jgi:hypothetical protein
MTTLFVVPAHQATKAGEIDSSESIPGSINIYKYGLGCFNNGRPPRHEREEK